jgi:hypothetical protein
VGSAAANHEEVPTHQPSNQQSNSLNQEQDHLKLHCHCHEYFNLQQQQQQQKMPMQEQEHRQRTESQQVAITAQAPVPFAPLPVDMAACLSAMAAGRHPSALYKSLATHTASSVKASDRHSRLLVV